MSGMLWHPGHFSVSGRFSFTDRGKSDIIRKVIKQRGGRACGQGISSDPVGPAAQEREKPAAGGGGPGYQPGAAVPL